MLADSLQMQIERKNAELQSNLSKGPNLKEGLKNLFMAGPERFSACSQSDPDGLPLEAKNGEKLYRFLRQENFEYTDGSHYSNGVEGFLKRSGNTAAPNRVVNAHLYSVTKDNNASDIISVRKFVESKERGKFNKFWNNPFVLQGVTYLSLDSDDTKIGSIQEENYRSGIRYVGAFLPTEASLDSEDNPAIAWAKEYLKLYDRSIDLDNLNRLEKQLRGPQFASSLRQIVNSSHDDAQIREELKELFKEYRYKADEI